MAVYHISMAFVTASDADLDSKVENVDDKMTGNPNFPTPDPPFTVIMPALDTFKKSVTAMNQGGTQATHARDVAREALITLLRQLVLYIEKICAGDPIKLLSSGFDITSSERAPVVLVKPAIQGIDFGGPGEVILHCGAMGSATFLKTQYRLPGGAWVDGPVSTSARSLRIPGLVSGQVNEFRVQAGAGNNNYSDWSDPVSHMAG